MKQYTIGIDFGSLSGRAVLMDARSGEILSSAVHEYSHGVMSETLCGGVALPLNTALQHPSDYIEVLRVTASKVLQESGVSPENVVALGFDFTGCTILPVDENMTPLCMDPQYCKNPHAYVKLWKHHASQPDADRINEIAAERGEPWLKIYGGKISSEWMFPKIRQILREAPEVYHATHRFMEAADWISYVLTGKETHSVSFAGFKALWNSEDGYPDDDFFGAVDPKMQHIMGNKVSREVSLISDSAGYLSRSGAELTGLCEGIPISIPILDAHASMPAMGITDDKTMMMIVGTSGVLVANSKTNEDVPGLCGYVYSAVLPGLYTYEAGQACCGDHFDWFVKNSVPVAYEQEAKEQGMNIHRYLREKAKVLAPGESGLLALDWFNGNRSVLSDASLKGMILGMTLRTRPEEIYRALIEATAFGNRVIFDTFLEGGFAFDRIVASGGIAEKDEMLMQIYADVLNRPILVSDAKMSASRGSAIYAAAAAGLYPDTKAAIDALSVKSGILYEPIPEHVAVYERLYREYKILHDYFGMGGNDVMKRLEHISQ